MLKMRLMAFFTSLIAGIFLGVIYAWSKHWLGAFGWLWTGAMAGMFFLFGCTVAMEWWYQLLGLWLCLYSIAIVLLDSPVTKIDVPKAQAELTSIFIQTSAGANSPPLSLDERRLAEQAANACALQNHIDLLQLTADLQKAEQFGPVMTLIDGLYSWTTSKQPMTCIDYYREFKKTRPSIFEQFNKNYPSLSNLN